MKKIFSASVLLASLTAASSVFAGLVADENAKFTAEDDSAWSIGNAGSVAANGVVDVYPSSWSIKSGDSIALKIRSTTNYKAKVFRMGWYGGGGASPVAEKSGSADPQPYPSASGDAYTKYGTMAAGWHDSLTFNTAGWVPGMYWVRVDQEGSGRQAATYFVVREPAGAAKWPILMMMPMNTEEAYNAWPGSERGGKSLYGFNSSATPWPTETIGMGQAVKVSFDRPFLVGAGTGDFTNYQYPAVRFVERFGYDVAYATDQDLDADPTIAEGRKAIVLVGHTEYYTRKNFDALINARNKGVSLLSISGDTINWQVRYEDGGKTLVGFKESADNSCPRDIDGCARKNSDGSCQFGLGECAPDYFKSQTKDPEAVAAHDALAAGDVEGAKSHFANVTTHWNTLFMNKKLGIDIRRPGFYLTGVQTAGIINNPAGWGFPWCDWIPQGSRSWWLYDKVTCDKIVGVGGYEVDSAATADRYYDPWRPTAGKDGVKIGQRRISSLTQGWDGKVRGSGSYYAMDNGAEVVALSAMAYTWGLDDYAARQNGAAGAESECSQQIVKNVLNRWMGDYTPEPLPDAGPMEDTGIDNPGNDDGGPLPEPDAGTPGDPDSTVVTTNNNATTEATGGSDCGCSTPGAAVMGGSAIASLGMLAGLSLLRRRRR